MKLATLAFISPLFCGYSVSSQKLSPNWEKPPPKHDLNSFCPPEGSPDSRDKELNLAKNRVDIPTFYHAVSFDEIKKLHAGDTGAERPRSIHPDSVRREIAQYEGMPVRLTGYIKFGRNDEHPDPKWIGVEVEGEESCNCGSKEKDQVDFHMWLVKKPGDPYKDAVVIEMAPRVRINNSH